MNVLNLCSGDLVDYDNIINSIHKINDKYIKSNNKIINILNIDYKYDNKSISKMEKIYSIFKNTNIILNGNGFINSRVIKFNKYYHNIDIYKFLNNTFLKFDIVFLHRYLEHVYFTDIEYFIYLLSKVVKKNGYIQIIVPDFQKLAQYILDDDLYIDKPYYEFSKHNISLSTELFNDDKDPHLSIWTKKRLEIYFQIENRFECMEIKDNIEIDNRNWYILGIFKRM